MQKYSVVWTHEASLDLNEIIEYILSDRPSAAITVYHRIKKHCSNLHSTPQRYRIVPELLRLGFKHYREINEYPYRVLYKVTDKVIYVVAVVDGRRDIEEFLFNRLLRKK